MYSMEHEHLSLAYARILFRHLRLEAESGTAFFNHTDLDYEGLMALDASVPFAVQRQLFANALKLADEPHLGLSVGRRLHLSSHGPLGVAAFSGQNLGVALECLARYSQMRAQFVELSVSEEGEYLCIRMHEPIDLKDIRCFLHESVMSAIYAAVEFFSGAAPLQGRMEFAFPSPEYAARYDEYFALPLHFDAPVTGLCLHKSLRALPSPVADEALHAQAVAQCEAALRKMQHERSLADQVRDMISRNPGKLWNSTDMATELNMSPRTLLRRLKEEGQSFQQVRDTVLMDLAKHYLREPNMTVELTGHLLGYSEVAAFRRSFKRVTGQTPAQFMADYRA